MKFTTMESDASENVATPRFRTLLFGLFAALAMILALQLAQGLPALGAVYHVDDFNCVRVLKYSVDQNEGRICILRAEHPFDSGAYFLMGQELWSV
jgi:hypothetical protein